jgi:hypothetical protein
MRLLIYSLSCLAVVCMTAVKGRGQGVVETRGDTVAVFFPLDVRTLSDAVTRKLDVLQYQRVLTVSKDFYIIGYADYVGRSSYNDTLSLARAESVKQYLLSSGFKEARLRLVTGRGEVSGRDSIGRGGFAPDRRVDIVPATGGFTTTPPPAIVNRRDTVTAVVPESALAPGSIPEPALKSIQRLLVAPVDSAVLIEQPVLPTRAQLHVSWLQSGGGSAGRRATGQPDAAHRIEGHVCCIDRPLSPTQSMNPPANLHFRSTARKPSERTHEPWDRSQSAGGGGLRKIAARRNTGAQCNGRRAQPPRRDPRAFALA